MTHQGNLIGLGGLLENRRHPAALRALQVLEDHDGNLRAFGWTQRRIYRLIRRRGQTSSEQQQQNSDPRYVFHPLFSHSSFCLYGN